MLGLLAPSGYEARLMGLGADPNTRGYRNYGRLLAMGARQHEVPVTDDALAHLATNLGVMRAVDDEIDTGSGASPSALANTLFHGQNITTGEHSRTIPAAELNLFMRTFEGYTPNTQERQLRLIGELFSYAPTYRDMTNPEALLDARLAEADVFASILYLGDGGRKAIEEYNKWSQKLARVGYVFDDVRDLKGDYANGRSRVAPTPFTYRVFTRALVRTSRELLHATPPSLFPLIGKTAVAGY